LPQLVYGYRSQPNDAGKVAFRTIASADCTAKVMEKALRKLCPKGFHGCFDFSPQKMAGYRLTDDERSMSRNLFTDFTP
jgi:hypothetical protein